jgi:hypothetical protein
VTCVFERISREREKLITMNNLMRGEIVFFNLIFSPTDRVVVMKGNVPFDR